MKVVLSIVFLSVLIGSLRADTPKDTFRLANEAFERGAIDDAIQLYESIASNHYGSAALYYNMGTAYIEKENWPAARYYLEKGRQEHPKHRNLSKNLEYVREQVDDVYNFPQFPLTGLVDTIHSIGGKSFISSLLLLFFVLILVILYKKPSLAKPLLYSCVSIWVLVFALFLLEWKNNMIYHEMAIVWNDQVQLYDKPEVDKDSNIANLRAGLKVRSMEKIGPWCRVELADGTTGWIEKKEIKFL